MKAIEKRKKLEKFLTNKIVSGQVDLVDELPRSADGKICSFSPYEFYNRTTGDCNLNGVYGHYSRKLHNNVKNPRTKIEGKILTLLGIQVFGTYPHLLFAEMGDTHEEYIHFCKFNRGCKVLNKAEWKELYNLIRRWRHLSSNEHFKLSKQAKRKLKKLESRL